MVEGNVLAAIIALGVVFAAISALRMLRHTHRTRARALVMFGVVAATAVAISKAAMAAVPFVLPPHAAEVLVTGMQFSVTVLFAAFIVGAVHYVSIARGVGACDDTLQLKVPRDEP